ncbi:MAG: HAMP domain-containing histidine kinase [Deltaproteobacteria bacterium]|nr:HAMP domain-containing histidine kinase [Deltaproteobacteria bacterium]
MSQPTCTLEQRATTRADAPFWGARPLERARQWPTSPFPVSLSEKRRIHRPVTEVRMLVRSSTGVSIHRATQVATLIALLLAALVAGALILLTALQASSGNVLRASVNGVRQGDATRAAILSFERSPDLLVRSQAEASTEQGLSDARSNARTEKQRAALERASAAVRQYFATANRPGAAPNEREQSLQEALTALNALSQTNIAEANSAVQRSARWDRWGDWLGYTGGGLLVATLLGAAIWLRRYVSEPSRDLQNAVGRFVGGDHEARAPEIGAAELRLTSMHFNRLALEQVRRREERLTYLSGVAHELREPLSALSMSLGLVAPDRALPPEPELRRLLALMKRHVERLNHQLGDFVETVRIESGRLELLTEVEDLNELVASLSEHFQGVTERHHVEIAVPGRPLVVRCDIIRIEEVITSLLANAARRSIDGAELRIALDVDQSEAVVTVNDDGEHLSSSELEHIWDHFKPTPTSTTNGLVGQGLSLSTVRRIVNAHGGEVFARREPDDSTTFGFRLPLLLRRPEQFPVQPEGSAPSPDGHQE